MKKTLALALALGFVSAGCAEEATDDVVTPVAEPAPVVTAPTDDLMMDTTGMMMDTTGMMTDAPLTADSTAM